MKKYNHVTCKKLLVFFLFIPTLFIAFNSLAQNNFFNVKSYGALGDGVTLDHKAINATIDACAIAGGGTVLVPSGTYLCGSIHLKSNINLLIDAGAIILGAPVKLMAYDVAEDFPQEKYQDEGHTYFHNSLIWGENLKNVSITGRGMINGGGMIRSDKERLKNDKGEPIPTADKTIVLKLCRNILIRDVTIFHGGHFAILATGCDLMTIDNLTVDTNRDGFDIDCCTNTILSNCRVNAPNDDAICPKSSYALNKPIITENLLITNCEVSGYKEGTLLDGTRMPAKVSWSSGRIKFGTESNGGFKNCVVSNCIFRNCNGFALEEVDGGTMENIVVTNITLQHVSHYPIYITLGARNNGPKETTKMGTAKNIFISNVIATDVDSLSGIQITGTLGYNVENIQLENVLIVYKGGGTKAQGERAFPELGKGYPEPFLLGINPAYGLFARHVKDLKLTNISFQTLHVDSRSAIVCNDVDGLQIIDVKVPLVEGIKPYRFDNVSNLVVRYSPLFEQK